MNIQNTLLAAVIGYGFGCLQSAFILGRLVKRIDIREHGSGNAGASNVTTIMGWKWGVITAAADIFKAVAAVLVIKMMYPGDLNLAFIAGAFSLIGHIFPCYLKFQGGKGLASYIGMLMAVDLVPGIITGLVLAAVTLATNYIALGALVVYGGLPVYLYLAGYPPACVIVSLTLAVIAGFKHYDNVKRIIRGEETGLRDVMKRKKQKAEGAKR